MEKDELSLEQVELACRVGTTAEERAFPQVLAASITLQLSLREAGQSDDLQKTVDYAILLEEIKSQIKNKTFHLIEAVAETVAGIVLKKERVQAVKVSIEKKIFPGVKSVGTTIWRSRS